jgi:hypothetical protein
MEHNKDASEEELKSEKQQVKYLHRKIYSEIRKGL